LCLCMCMRDIIRAHPQEGASVVVVGTVYKTMRLARSVLDECVRAVLLCVLPP
jgi:hypothetical protein